MRIRDKRPVHQRTTSGSTVKRESAGVFTDAELDFQDVLRQQQRPYRAENLEELLKRLDELGDRLAKSFSVYDLKAYKDTLRDFLRNTSGQAYGIKEETILSKKGKTKVYQIIEKIDGELEELSALVLSKHKDQVKILAKLDQIRGLMIDLYS